MKEVVGFSNFKAFGNKLQRFSKKPITLVYGANSIGKSSFLHRELYTQYILKHNSFDVNKTTMFGDEIDFGGFDKFVHKRDPQNTIQLHFETEGFEELYDSWKWKTFFDFTKEDEETLFARLETLTQEELESIFSCVAYVQEIKAKKRKEEQERKLRQNNTQKDIAPKKKRYKVKTKFESYKDIQTLFDPQELIEWSQKGYGEIRRLPFPILNPCYLEEVSLLLNREVTMEFYQDPQNALALYRDIEKISLTSIIEEEKENENSKRAALAQKLIENNEKAVWMFFHYLPVFDKDLSTTINFFNYDVQERRLSEKRFGSYILKNIHVTIFSAGFKDPLKEIIANYYNVEYYHNLETGKYEKEVSEYRRTQVSNPQILQKTIKKTLDLVIFLKQPITFTNRDWEK